jgi:hypothetical protein
MGTERKNEGRKREKRPPVRPGSATAAVALRPRTGEAIQKQEVGRRRRRVRVESTLLSIFRKRKIPPAAAADRVKTDAVAAAASRRQRVKEADG